MAEWCIAHPYLTFIIIVCGLVIIEEWLTVINNKIKLKMHTLELNNKKDKE